MSLSLPQKPIAIYIDADACPVKQEVYRVAERHALKGAALKVFVVSNSPIAVPRDEMVERVVVGSGMDEADNWIAERAGRSDVVITTDIPLASRCVKNGATAIGPNGKPFTEDSIGMTLATRNLIAVPAPSPAGRSRLRRATARIFSRHSIRRWYGSSATGLDDQRTDRRDGVDPPLVPAKACGDPGWIPAFAGMSGKQKRTRCHTRVARRRRAARARGAVFQAALGLSFRSPSLSHLGLWIMDSGLRLSAGPGMTKAPAELRLPHFENVIGPNQSRRISPKLLPASFTIVLVEGSLALDLT